MTAAESSFLGIAKQSGFGVANTTDDDFKYLLFRQGSIAANNVILPLDPEVGGGAINPRAVVKAGVNSGGMVDVVFRPETMGWFLYGVTGNVTTYANSDPDAITAGKATSGALSLTGGATITFDDATQVYAYLTGNATSSATLTINGTDAGNQAISETFDLSTGSAASYDETTAYKRFTGALGGSRLFKTITSGSLSSSVTGGSASVGLVDGSYTHVFKLGTDQFDAPYFTMRYAPGNMWGEQFKDCRIAAMSMAFAGARFVDGAVQFVGRTPSQVATTTWAATNKVDTGPQFLGSTDQSAMELPLGESAAVLSGSFVAATQIPLDEQFVIGSYEPESVDIVSRSFAVQMNIKVDDGDLYKKMVYDADGGSNWVANVYKEGNFKLKLASGEDAASVKAVGGTARKYSVQIAGNGSTGSDANVTWTAQPIALRAGRQVVMQVSGIFHPSPGSDPITITLVNRKSSY